jgi:RNA polymerase sigma factor (sigma-70 family)
LLLARKARSIRKPVSLASWLHGAAYRLALRARAQRESRHRHEDLSGSIRNVGVEEVTWRELRFLIDQELQCLPEKWRSPLILCYLEGKTQDEAARQLNWSKNTFRRRLTEAREALGRRLVRRGVGLSAALCAPLLSDCVAMAAISPSLVASTVKAAARIAVGCEVAGIVPANVMKLTEGVMETMKTMLLTKLKIIAFVFLAVAVTMTSYGQFMQQSLAATQDYNKAAKTNSRGGAQALSPQNKTTVGEQPPVRLREKHSFQHKDAIAAVAFGQGFVAVGDVAGKLNLWDMKTGKLRDALLDGKLARPINAIQVSRNDGQVYVVSANGELIEQSGVGGGVKGQRAFGVTPDGKLWAMVRGDKMQLEFLENTFDKNIVPNSIVCRIDHDDEVSQLAFAPDSTCV